MPRGPKKRPVGRPRAADGRSNILRIRLTDAERQSVDEAAKSLGLETSTWARMEILTGVRRIKSG
jgi:hypothetical protein